MSLFKRAQLGMNLTPGERAILKLVEGWLIAGFISALLVFVTGASSPHPDWSATLKVAGSAFIVATAFAVLKYLKAQRDAPLPPPTPTVPPVPVDAQPA